MCRRRAKPAVQRRIVGRRQVAGEAAQVASCRRRRRPARACGRCARGTRRGSSAPRREARPPGAARRRGARRSDSRIRSLATRSSWITQPAGRVGNSASTSLARRPRGMPVTADSTSSKRNSRRCWPTKSRMRQLDLSGLSRRPRPICCRKTVALEVGRRKSSVSTKGRSMPFVEEVAGEEDVHLAVAEALGGRGAVRGGRCLRGRPWRGCRSR